MRRGRAQARRQSHHWVLAAVIALFVALIVGGVVWYIVTRDPKPDQLTMCPAKGPVGHIVLLVDRTDPLTFTQKQAFQTFIEELVGRRVPAGWMLSVFALGEDFTKTAEPLFELCNPGEGTDKSDLTENVARLKRQFGERFRGPMLKLAEQLQSQQSAKYSPILEMVQLVAINGFRRHSVAGPRQLIIVSDMLHNMPPYSMYGGDFDFSRFRDSPYGRRTVADLRDVEVEIQYLLSSPRLQVRRHVVFWEDYFRASGGRLVAVRPVEG